MSDDRAGNDPHAWLVAYGIRAHYFVWAVAHGALDDIDPPTHCEHWTQPALIPGEAALCSPPPPQRRLYRSRAPNEIDVPRWNRATLRALPTTPRLSRKRVLR